jgi:hypothetical protein
MTKLYKLHVRLTEDERVKLDILAAARDCSPAEVLCEALELLWDLASECPDCDEIDAAWSSDEHGGWQGAPS